MRLPNKRAAPSGKGRSPKYHHPRPQVNNAAKSVQDSTRTQFLQAKAWLVWRSETFEGEPKPRKVPHYANGNRRGANGTDADRAALVTYEEARAACKRGGYSGIGIAPLDTVPFFVVDLDKCLLDGKLTRPELQPLVDATYAEISPSGTGLHLIFAGKCGPSTKNVPGGIELFGHSGFATFTAKRFNQRPIAAVTDAIKETLRGLLGRKDHEPDGADDFASGDSLGKLQRLLDDQPIRNVDDREAWLRIGMAMHSATGGSDAGFTLWDTWSRRSPRYGGTEAAWKSFKLKGNASGLVGAGTLAYMANRDAASGTDPLALSQPVDPWPPLDKLAAIDAMRAEPPDLPMLFVDLMPHGELLGLGGPGGVGKSWFTMQCAISVALGISLCGRWECAQNGPVLILNAELSENGFWRRLRELAFKQLWSDAEWADAKTNIHFLDLAGEDIRFTKMEHSAAKVTGLAQRLLAAADQRDYRLIVVDPSIQFREGNENDAMVQAAFAKALLPLCRAGKTSVLLVAHTGKDPAKESTNNDFRGSRAITDAVRWAAVMRSMNNKDLETYPVCREDLPAYARLTVTKFNDGPFGMQFWLHRSGGVLWHAELKPVKTDSAGQPVMHSQGKVSDDAILLAYDAEPRPRLREAAIALGIAHQTLGERIAGLVAKGVMVRHGRGKTELSTTGRARVAAIKSTKEVGDGTDMVEDT